MQDFLSDYIWSTASKSKEKVQKILAAAQASKEDLDSIALRIQNIQSRSPIAIRPEQYGGLVTGIGLDAVQRDTDIRLRELYDDSNLISLLADTNTETLSSDIKKQRDQLLTMEKYINNYSFMLADGGFYDHAYTESFSDDIQQESSSILSAMLYDRSGKAFDRQLESLEVDQGTGTLVMSSGFKVTYPYKPVVSKTNAGAYITSDTGIGKSVTSDLGEGWRVAISSPRPVYSALYPELEKGCQFEIEMFLDQPSLCDSFSIYPMADMPVDILSIKVYDAGNTNYQELINTSFRLDKNRVFFFARQNIMRVSIILNQPVYTRGKLPAAQSEVEYKEALVAQPHFTPNTKRVADPKTNRAFQRMFKKWSLFKDAPKVSLYKPVAQIDKYAPEKLDAKEALSYEKDQYNLYSRFKVSSRKQSIFIKWMIEKLFKDQPDLLSRFSNNNIGPHNPNTEITSALPGTTEPVSLDALNYEYTLGIRSMSLGITNRETRGLFISKPVPAPVQPGVVRLKTEDVNYQLLRSYLDNKFVTSIEYSVTNKSNAVSEQDWIPIIPSNKREEILNERLFPQSSGYASLRFRGRNMDSITVYKNGFIMDSETISFVRSDDTFSIRGIQIPASQFSLNADDIYTVDYHPEGDPTTVVFSEYGFKDKSLASAYDDNGAGELFSGTGASNHVALKNHPYVDYKTIESDSTYSEVYGLISSYQPISIVLADGTIAYNYTNYKGLVQNVLSSDSSMLAFVHSGTNLIFNKQINQSFRVYYQYEPSYLRYRIIYRVNTEDRTSPIVDSVTIKSKMGSSILGLNNKKV